MTAPYRLACAAALLLLACGSGEASSRAESLWVAGDSVYWTGAHDSAHAIWTAALEDDRVGADSALVARLLTSLGMAERQLGDYGAARRHGEAALALKLRLRPPPDLFTSYNALGLLAWGEGRLADAARLLASAGGLARAGGDAEQIAKVANNLALVRAEEGDFAAARGGFAEALAAARAAAVPRLEGNALTNDAMLDIRVGRPERAVRSLHLARLRYREVGYAAGEVSALGQLGVALQATGNFPGAFAALDTALALARAHKLRQEEASNLEALADAHYVAGDGRRALALYGEADVIDRELGLAVELGSNLRQAALIYAGLGQRGLAIRKAAAALTVHRDAGARAEELRDLLLLAELDGATGRAAGTYLAAAAALVDTLGARTGRVDLALAVARHEAELGHPARALAVLDRARADFAAGGYDSEWQAADLAAAAWAALGQLDSAAAAGRAAVAAVERVRGQVGSGELRTSYLARRSGAYARLVDILLRLGDTDDALAVADAMRGRALLEHLPAGAGPRGEAQLARLGVLAERADSLDAQPAEPGDSIAHAVRRAARAALARARSEYETMVARGGASETPASERGHVDLRALRGALHPGEAVVEYLIQRERLDIFVITRDNVRHVASGIAERSLRTRVRLARDLLADSSVTRERVAPVLTGLHEALVTPAERAGLLRGVASLTIVPFGGLAYAPFAALINPSSGRHLVQDYVIRIAPSAAVLARQRTVRFTLGRISASLAMAPFPAELPGSRDEVRAVGRLRPAHAGVEGASATERRLRDDIAAAGIVHLATHATMNPANPLFSRIDLHAGPGHAPDDDGRLEVHEILGLRVAGALVFLSGCETGLGDAWSTPFQQGEDYTTLMQAFLQAGAGAVVGTLWRVRDDGAAALAEAFYGRLPHGSPAAALAEAQRALLASDRWSSPYHWAGYAVAGD